MARSKNWRLRVAVISMVLQIGILQCDAQFVIDVLKQSMYGEEELVHKCPASGATFGRDVSDFILTDENLGCLIPVTPIDACKPVTVKPEVHLCRNPFALVSRSDHAHPCKFSVQAFNVQNTTYTFKMVIMYNYPDLDPITMEGAEHRSDVLLPVIMMTYSCMEDIMTKFPMSNGYRLRVRIDPGYYELFRYLIPFVVVIFFCFALFLITLCVRGCVERRKMNKRRLSKRNLKKIPIKKYRAGDEPETCAICLEDFLPGEKLRHLPCRHVFHCKCIDVWLTQTRKVCPLCKRKIGSDSDSEGSTEDLRENQPNQSSTDDNVSNNTDDTTLTVPSSSRPGETWSSQEALVDRDVLFAQQRRVTLGGMLLDAIRRVRHNTNEIDEENGVGMENDAYHSQQAPVNRDDSEHLLENEEETSVSTAPDTSMYSSDANATHTSADVPSTLDTTDSTVNSDYY